MEMEKQEGLADVASRVCETGGTVSGLGPEQENVVLGKEQWTVVRARRHAGKSVSQIARELGIDRKIVRRCLQQDAWRPYER